MNPNDSTADGVLSLVRLRPARAIWGLVARTARSLLATPARTAIRAQAVHRTTGPSPRSPSCSRCTIGVNRWRCVLQARLDAPPMPQGVRTARHRRASGSTQRPQRGDRLPQLPGRGGRLARRRARSCRSVRTPARWASPCGSRNGWPEESAGQCGPCYLGLPAAARGMADILNGGGPAALEALKQVAQNVKRRGACSHPDGSARCWPESTVKAFTDDLAAHALGNGCGRPVQGVLPLFEGGRAPTGIPGGGAARGERPQPAADPRRLDAVPGPRAVRGHPPGGLPARRGRLPRPSRKRRCRGTRRPRRSARCAAARRSPCASRRTTGPQPPARRNLPVLSPGRGRRALGR
ncbi:hypothetical protein SVIOM74S_04026 [Streptomyces violarus]